MKKAFPIDHAVPISKAIRAGDFVYTSAFGAWIFNPLDITYDEAGNILDDGTGNHTMPFEEQVHKTFDFIKAALAVADCTLDDVISSECWLTTHTPLNGACTRAGAGKKRVWFFV